MPQQERNKKAATKALAEAASKPGQLKLTSLFAVESESQPSTSRNADETTVAEEGPQSQTNENVHMEMIWVKCADDFTDVDKERSERSGRYFRREWFESYTWLVCNREKKMAFCETCATYQSDGTHKGVFGNYEVGFGNWKKGPEKFKEHEQSLFHITAKATRGQQSISSSVAKQCELHTELISSVCNSHCLATQVLRRQGLVAHLHTLKTLLRQGVAIRGNTDLDSNIYQFNLDKARNDKALKLLLDEKHYVTVHDILSEQEQMLVLSARRNLLNKILGKRFYSILADESSDVSKTEQLSFSVRTCDDSYKVSEDFIGIYECSQGLSSDALLHYTKDILLRCGMDGENMAAMSFDGAAAMKSLARMLKVDVAPNAIYVHCFAHCNELIVKDATKLSDLLATSPDLCQSLYAWGPIQNVFCFLKKYRMISRMKWMAMTARF